MFVAEFARIQTPLLNSGEFSYGSFEHPARVLYLLFGSTESCSMGVWGAGNFDGDLPRDFLADMVFRWEQLVEALLAGNPREETADYQFDLRLETCEACLMPMLEIIITVAERLDPDYLPALEVVERWQSQYLSLFDREIGRLDGGPEFEAERREVIAATFGRSLDIVRSRSGAEPDKVPKVQEDEKRENAPS